VHVLRNASRLAVIAACFALTPAGCGASGPGPNADGREAAAQFLGDLRADRLGPAWQGTTPEFKSLMGLESLRDCVKAHTALKGPAEYVESRDASRDGRAMVEHVFKAEGRTRGKPVTSTVKLLVTRAGDGSWSVEYLRVE